MAASTVSGVLDSHVHFWDLSHPEIRWDWVHPGVPHPILGDIEAIKAPRFDAAALWAEARFAGVSGFVHVQAASSTEEPAIETAWVDEQFRRSGLAGAIVGHVDLRAADVDAVLDRHAAASDRFSGVRDFGVEPLLSAGVEDPSFEASMDELARRGLVLDLDCEWPNMVAAAALAERHPNLQIVLEHAGYPRRRDEEYFGSWAAGLSGLAAAENVHCKISGLGMTDRGFTRDRLSVWARFCVEAFTPERCLVGTNWPVDRIASSYDRIIDCYRDLVASLTPSEQSAVLHDNAARLYRIS